MLMNMADLLAVANKNYFAVPAFNISDYSMLNGIFEASEEKNAPLIIAIHPDELKFIGVEMVKRLLKKRIKQNCRYVSIWITELILTRLFLPFKTALLL